jgi:hypothetical protein
MSKFIKTGYDYVSVDEIKQVEFKTLDISYKELESELEICGESCIEVASIILKNNRILPVFITVCYLEENTDENIREWFKEFNKRVNKLEDMLDEILKPHDLNIVDYLDPSEYLNSISI